MAYRASYEFKGGQSTGSVIGAEHFGTNYLFHHDRVGADSTFPEIVDRIGMDLIRYPGGTITEEFFDLANPTASVQSSTFGRADKTVTPLDEFLHYAADSGSEAIIVLPTYRYFDTGTRQIDPAAEAEIKTFVRAVLSGEYGEATIRGFEIGNEWYQHRFEWNAAEFGELQSRIGSWIDEVTQEQADWADVGVYVQSGRGDDDGNGIADDQELAAQFTEAEMAAIDGLTSHFYASTGSGNPLVLGGNVNRRLNEIAEHWNTTGEDALDLVVTEWNIGENGEGDTSVTGLMRSVALLNVFSNMVEKGVDVAAIWTAQAPAEASLSTKEGDTHLTATGYLYRMMRRELVETRAVETTQDDGIRDASGALIGRSYVFESADKTVIYMASGVGERIDLNVDFARYMGADAHVHATVLGVAEGSGAADYRAVAQMNAISHGTLGADGRHKFALDPYEVVQIVITRGTGVTLIGDDENATADVFDGSLHDDALHGLGGDDALAGKAGDDLLEGGDGNDLLRGGDGQDTLDGGTGDDLIDGGTGDDLILAGTGADSIEGGEGADTLDYSDSAGAVRIYAGDGVTEKTDGDSDQFSGIEHFVGSDHGDTIFTAATTASVDSGAGDDFVRMIEGEDLQIDTGEGRDYVLAEHGSATVDLGAGDDQLLSYAATLQVDGGAGDDLIRTGRGSDTIDGGAGNDTLSGGEGADVFVFDGEAGTDLILDFEIGVDRLDLTALHIGLENIEVVDTGRGAEIRVDGDSIVELQSISAAQVTEDFFDF